MVEEDSWYIWIEGERGKVELSRIDSKLTYSNGPLVAKAFLVYVLQQYL